MVIFRFSIHFCILTILPLSLYDTLTVSEHLEMVVNGLAPIRNTWLKSKEFEKAILVIPNLKVY